MALTIATGIRLGLLTVQYALFTAAITTYAVVLADTLGEPTWEADKLRLIGTFVGLADHLLGLRILARPGAGEGSPISGPEAGSRPPAPRAR